MIALSGVLIKQQACRGSMLQKEDVPLLTSCFLEEKLSSEFASSPILMLSSEFTFV